MANYQNLKAAISAAIRTNGNQEITGQVLQDVLNSIVSVIGANYTFAGVVTPSTNPGTPDQNVMYLAMEGGTYTNFNGTVLPAGISLLMWNGSWRSETVMYGDGGVFDISVYKSSGGTLAMFADLAAALDGGNNIPASARKGGMSVKFVQSSDNNYVQARCIADEFTTDVTQWVIADEGVYVENPEFIYVKTDKNNKILWAIKTDGGIYYGAGVPQQVVDYINEKLEELSLDEYEDIVAFLNGLEKGDKTLQALLNEKVDKEEGKSLINVEYASAKSTIDNPEFLEVTTDSWDKVLEGIQADGTKVIGGDLNVGGSANLNGDLRVLGNMEVSGVSYKVIESPEYLAAWIDAEDKIIFGFKTDGKTYVGDADFLDDIESIKAFLANFNDKNIDWDALTSFNAIENPEFMEVELDAEDRVLGGRKTDGTKVENNDVELNGNATVGGSLEVDGVVIKNIEDPEGRHEVTLDSEEKIINYRKDDGTLVENVGIETPNITAENISAKEVNIEGGEATLEKATLNSLELTNEGMTEFQQALKDSGFRPGGAGDYSDTITNKGKKPVFIPMPRLAMVNIIWDGNLSNLSKSDRPDGVQKVNYDVKVPVEFFDGQGIYFKKYALMSAQGNSSMSFIKKNISLKFFDTEDVEGKKKKWGKGDTFGTVFGNWVMQKTYHLKAFYTDFIRGSSEVAYQLADEVYKTRGVYADRPWKKALIDFSNINSCTPAGLSEDGINDMNLQIDNGARCMPDGFPVIVYQNGEFYGIYVWMLKKDADNFNMDTSNVRHIHLDGTLYAENLWGGNINWTAFEIRNPEDLVCMDGSDYNGDFPAELIDSTSEYYDSTDENHVRSAQVKQYIINLSHRVGEINSLNATDSSAAKELFDTYFDADNLIDYQLINMACGDSDGFGKNWQWTTWDGIKWYVNQYDKDMAFGNYWRGTFTIAPRSGWINNSINLPSGLAIRYYTQEHKARWQELVNAGIFKAEHIKSMVTAWINSIGKGNFVQEWKKWTESPCNRDSKINFAYWKFTGVYSGDQVPTSGNIWDKETVYNVGDKVWFKAFDGTWYLQFEAVKAGSNHPCLTDSYSVYPKSMGYRDSAWRYYKYIEETISNQNSFINSL